MFTFTRYANAKAFVDHAIMIMLIVHGDDDRLWVVTPRDATRMAAQGYEVVGLHG